SPGAHGFCLWGKRAWSVISGAAPLPPKVSHLRSPIPQMRQFRSPLAGPATGAPEGRGGGGGARTPPRRVAWALTGSGHFFTECLESMSRLERFDLFVSRAAAEVIRMYKSGTGALPKDVKIYKDTTASAAPVGLFYEGVYHTLVLAP